MDPKCTRETTDKFVYWVKEILRCIDSEGDYQVINQSNVVPVLAKIESQLNELAEVRNYYAVKDKMMSG